MPDMAEKFAFRFSRVSWFVSSSKNYLCTNTYGVTINYTTLHCGNFFQIYVCSFSELLARQFYFSELGAIGTVLTRYAFCAEDARGMLLPSFTQSLTSHYHVTSTSSIIILFLLFCNSLFSSSLPHHTSFYLSISCCQHFKKKT